MIEMPEKTKMPSRREMREMMLPKVADILDNKYRVIYVNNGKFRFTATANKDSMPVVGHIFEVDGKIWQVDRIDNEKGRFIGIFKGFKENPIEEAPHEEEGEELVKLI